jgi:hypothetical protein
MLPPNRCGKHTAPLAVERSPDSPARSRCERKISCTKIRPTAVRARGSRASSRRSSNGTESTHCRNGTSGITSSVKCAAVPHMRRALQDGHTPRFLHDSATSRSLPHERQRARKKPCAKIPHFKYSRSSRSTYCGRARFVRLARFCEKRFEVLSDNLVEWCSLGLVPLVAFRRDWRWPLARSVRSHQGTISERRAT